MLVKYRNGGSGNGDEIYYIYNVDTKTWRRLHANQFLNGEGLMSGYFEGPTLGHDGNFHLIWVWRNTPNSASNHSLSYAKSADLVTWTDSNGAELSLPLTLSKTEVVDPVPPFGGMINGNVKIGFDQQHRPVISYHKYDASGNTQFYVVRKEQTQWRSVQISNWKNYRWEFSGPGSLGRFDVVPTAPVIIDGNTLGVTFRKGNDVMQFVLNAQSLQTLRIKAAEFYPSILDVETKRVNRTLIKQAQLPIEFHVFKGVGDKSPSGKFYYLSWLSQPGNRDQAHQVISTPSVLLLQVSK